MRGRVSGPAAKLANVDMDRPGASAVMPIVVTVIVSFVTAWVLAGAPTIAWHFYGGGYSLVGAPHGADPVGGVHGREVHHPRRLRGPPAVAHRAQHRP